MGKLVKIVTMTIVLTVILTLSLAGGAFADNTDSPGPAPNSHDGVPDGPGFSDGIIPNGPNGEIW